MKKQYTKKQIQEAIQYWERQLEAENYRKTDESEDPAAKFLSGAVRKFKDEKLDPKDWKKLDDRLWEEMQAFVKEYGDVYGIELKGFSLAVDRAWSRGYDANSGDKMFLALGDSTRQAIISAHK